MVTFLSSLELNPVELSEKSSNEVVLEFDALEAHGKMGSETVQTTISQPCGGRWRDAMDP
jgi:hypothetical protein